MTLPEELRQMVGELFRREIYKGYFYKVSLHLFTMKKIFFMVLMIIAFSGSVSAITQINIYVDSFGDALFLGQADESLILPEGIEIVDGKISGITSELTSKTGDSWLFEYNLSGDEMNVILPVGAKITSLSGGEIFLEKDQIAVFVKDNIKVEYVIEKESSKVDNIALTLIGVAFALALMFYIKNYIKKSREDENGEKDRFETVKGVLNERERAIIDKLKETGKIKSSYLRKQTDIPKASFSRHIQELEKKGLIKRSGEGKNKIIELVK